MSEELVNAFVRIFLDKLNHPIRHDWLSVVAFDISKWHLHVFVFVDIQFREVDIRDLLQGFFFLYYHASYPYCCVRSHLLGAKSSSDISLFTQLSGAV